MGTRDDSLAAYTEDLAFDLLGEQVDWRTQRYVVDGLEIKVSQVVGMVLRQIEAEAGEERVVLR